MHSPPLLAAITPILSQGSKTWSKEEKLHFMLWSHGVGVLWGENYQLSGKHFGGPSEGPLIFIGRLLFFFLNSVFTLSGTGQEKEAAISQVWAVQMCILQTQKLCMQSTSRAGLITQAVRSCPCNHEKEFNPEGCVRKEGRKVECAHNPCAGDMDTSRAWRLVSQPVYLT